MAKKKPAPKKQAPKQKPKAEQPEKGSMTYSEAIGSTQEPITTTESTQPVIDEVVGDPDILETKKPYDPRTDSTKELPVVYGSKEPSIRVETEDFYGGAHRYYLKNCIGWSDGKTQYVEDETVIQIVKKEPGTDEIIPGIQHQQLLMLQIDSLHKMYKKFPSPQTERAIRLLQQALACLDERVKERVDRNVMGELKT